jgi:hypothetical protein
VKDRRAFRFLTREQFDRLSPDEQFEYLRIAVIELAKTRAMLRADRERILGHVNDRAEEHT